MAPVEKRITFGQWAFAELTEIYEIEQDFEAKIRSSFDTMIDSAITGQKD